MNILKFLKFVFPLALSASLLSSCATIFFTGHPTVILYGDVDESLTVTTSYATYDSVSLPARVRVNRKHLEGQTIHMTSEHYQFRDIQQTRTVSWEALAVGYLGGFMGAPVDLLTNSYSKSAQTEFHLQPIVSADSTPPASTTTYAASYIPPRAPGCSTGRFRRHELSLGFGVGANVADGAVDRMVDGYAQRYDLAPEGGCGDVWGSSFALLNLEYHYRLNSRWAVGCMVGWGTSREGYGNGGIFYQQNSFREDQEYAAYSYGSERSSLFYVAPSLRYTWYDDASMVRLYSCIALGIVRRHLTFSCWDAVKYQDFSTIPSSQHEEWFRHELGHTDAVTLHPTYQLTFIGGDVGTDVLRCFAELGYGCQGVFKLGIRKVF